MRRAGSRPRWRQLPSWPKGRDELIVAIAEVSLEELARGGLVAGVGMRAANDFRSSPFPGRAQKFCVFRSLLDIFAADRVAW